MTPGGIEYYLPLFFRQTATLFDYLADDAVIVLGEGAIAASEHFWTNTAERYEQRAHDIERPVLPPAELYLSPEQLREQLNRRLRATRVPAVTSLPGFCSTSNSIHSPRYGWMVPVTN